MVTNRERWPPPRNETLRRSRVKRHRWQWHPLSYTQLLKVGVLNQDITLAHQPRETSTPRVSEKTILRASIPSSSMMMHETSLMLTVDLMQWAQADSE
jgi:hypothetical protein